MTPSGLTITPLDNGRSGNRDTTGAMRETPEQPTPTEPAPTPPPPSDPDEGDTGAGD